MYKNNFVVSVKHNGKILRELNSVASLPFNSEYSVLLKNMSSRKAVANVKIDGTDVLDGNTIIVLPDSTVELKGFLTGHTVKNKFKFIRKTEKISNYRGDKPDDSLIRVEYRFEKEKVQPTITTYPPYNPHLQPTWYNSNAVYGCNDIKIGNSLDCNEPRANCCLNSPPSFTKGVSETNVYSYSALQRTNGRNYNPAVNQVDTGITVKGSETKQDFTTGRVDEVEATSHVITLQLVGETEKSVAVKKPLLVKERITCSTCGTKSKSFKKFCGECGAFLH